MTRPRSDALVLFGASGDLAYKQIFPALQAMVKRGTLTVPVIAVTGESRDTNWWHERVHASLQRQGEVDRGALRQADEPDALRAARLHRSAELPRAQASVGRRGAPAVLPRDPSVGVRHDDRRAQGP